MDRVWFITGSSRGLGKSITEEVLQNGDIVVATARKPSALNDLKVKYGDRIHTIALDVSDSSNVEAAVSETIGKYGRIDILVNNAGYGFLGAVEEQTLQDIRDQIETNLFGTMYVTKAVVSHMRKQKSGHIFQVSSIGGRRGVPGLSAYNAAKFGVEGFSEALSQEVSSLGIHVTIVEPGGFRTDWAGSSMDYAKSIDDYKETVGVLKKYMQGSVLPLGDPEKAARAIFQVAESKEPPLHLLLGSDAVHLLEQSEKQKLLELEKWRTVSLSTDVEGAINVFATEAGKLFQG